MLGGSKRAFWAVVLLLCTLGVFVSCQNDVVAAVSASSVSVSAPPSSPSTSGGVVATGTSPDPMRSCAEELEPGRRRPGDTFMLIETSSVEECCNTCRNNDACKSWTRQRATGMCALKRRVPERVDGGNDFDSGVSKPSYVHAGETPDDEVPLEFPCPTEEGKSRSSESEFVGNLPVATSEACCRACEDVPNCYSWSFKWDGKNCDMYSGIPDPHTAPGYDTGQMM